MSIFFTTENWMTRWDWPENVTVKEDTLYNLSKNSRYLMAIMHCTF